MICVFIRQQEEASIKFIFSTVSNLYKKQKERKRRSLHVDLKWKTCDACDRDPQTYEQKSQIISLSGSNPSSFPPLSGDHKAMVKRGAFQPPTPSADKNYEKRTLQLNWKMILKMYFWEWTKCNIFFSFKKKKSLTLFLIASEKKTGGTIAQNIRPNWLVNHEKSCLIYIYMHT